MLVDLAVMLADGGRGISGLAVLRDRPELFGSVASTATAWRVLDGIDGALLAAVRAARARARERLWAQREAAVGPIRASAAGGRDWPGLRLVIDATLVTCHSEKELASATFKGGFGYHPLTVWLDNTNEALAAVQRTGRAGSNTAADHIAVTDLALAQIPEPARHGTPILISADGAGSTKDWLTHLRGQRETGLDLEFSVGFTATEAVQAAILALPECAWTPAIKADGSPRDGADVAELTGLLRDLTAAGWPAGMRVIVRRERPHPGAQLRFTDHDGWRFQTFATDTPPGWRGGGRAVGPTRGPPPGARPGRGPDPLRQEHRAGPIRPPANTRSTSLARAHPDRLRPDRLDPDHPARWRPGPRRTRGAALQAAPRRRPAHPRTTPAVPPDRRRLALATRPRRRVRPPPRPTAARHLRPRPAATTHDQTPPETPTTASAARPRPHPASPATTRNDRPSPRSLG